MPGVAEVPVDRRRPYLPAALAGLLVLFIFASSLPELLARWFAERSYYHHAPLVPIICAWLLWRDRERLRRVPRSSSPWGLLIVAPALWIQTVGVLEGSALLQRWALIGVVFGCALVLLGGRVARATWFPWVFLVVFMIPLPALLLNALSLQLKLAAAKSTHVAIEALGIAAVLRGDSIHFTGGRTVLVDDVCSGLRSLLALLAMAALFAHLQRARWKAALMLALAVPVAVLSNALRVLVLCLLAARGSPAASEGFWHEATGLLIYSAALLAFYGVHSLPEREASPEAPAPPGATKVEAAPSWGPWTIALLVLLALGGATGLWTRTRPGPNEPGRSSVTRGIPVEIGDWKGVEVAGREVVRAVLGTDDFVHRRYARPADHASIDLFVLHTETAAGMHAPPMCYTLQGFTEVERGLATLKTEGQEVSALRTVITQGGQTHLVYFWYRLNNAHVVGDPLSLRFSRIGRRLLLGGASAHAATIRLSTRIDGNLAAGEARIAAFARDALATLLSRLP